MGMGFAPTWLRQVSPPPALLHKTTLTTGQSFLQRYSLRLSTGDTVAACRPHSNLLIMSEIVATRGSEWRRHVQAPRRHLPSTPIIKDVRAPLPIRFI